MIEAIFLILNYFHDLMLPEPKIVWNFEDWFLKEIELEDLNKIATNIANEVIKTLKDKKLDCVSGGYDDVQGAIYKAVRDAVKNNIKGD
jgi:hypothetical protein